MVICIRNTQELGNAYYFGEDTQGSVQLRQSLVQPCICAVFNFEFIDFSSTERRVGEYEKFTYKNKHKNTLDKVGSISEKEIKNKISHPAYLQIPYSYLPNLKV